MSHMIPFASRHQLEIEGFVMDFVNSDIPDPTDFPVHSVAPGLRSLDGSFRCDICGDWYDAPVTIACGHCFCSMVCRNALFSDLCNRAPYSA